MNTALEQIKTSISKVKELRHLNFLITETFDLAEKQCEEAIKNGKQPFEFVVKDNYAFVFLIIIFIGLGNGLGRQNCIKFLGGVEYCLCWCTPGAPSTGCAQWLMYPFFPISPRKGLKKFFGHLLILKF